jgi:Zn finger protein HypA/HybF involved in hydrogenase expression
MFASRPFLAALLTASFMRWGEHVPLVDEEVSAALSNHAPAWFVSNAAMGVMAVLAALEIYAAKSPEVRAFLEEIDGFVKSGVAVLVSLALLDKESVAILKTVDHQGLFGLHTVWALMVGGAVYVMATLRRLVLEWIFDLDDNDDLGVQTLLMRVETLWTAGGLFFIVVFPAVAIALSAATALGLWWLQKRAEYKEERQRVPCAHCQAPIHPSALTCHVCGKDAAAPRRIGVFGQPKSAAIEDRELHRLLLVGRKRCPVCATRLKQRVVQQDCPTCKRRTFASPQEFEQYLGALDARLPRTLVVCFLLGAIPIVGVIPGVAYFRLTLVSGLRGYLPPLRGCVSRWIVRIVNWVLIGFQVIPFAGALVLPTMCVTNYWIYRRALRGRAQDDLAPSPAPGAASA